MLVPSKMSLRATVESYSQTKSLSLDCRHDRDHKRWQGVHSLEIGTQSSPHDPEYPEIHWPRKLLKIPQ